MGTLPTKIVAILSAAMVCLAFLSPAEDYDLFTFVGVLHRYDHPAEVALERTKAELRESLSPERYRWITGEGDKIGYEHAVATRPEVFDAQLRWFYGRPLFTRSAWLLTKLGISSHRALHGISLASGGLLAILLFRLTRVLDPRERCSTYPLDYDPWRERLGSWRTPWTVSKQWWIDLMRLGMWGFLMVATDVWGITRSPLSDALGMLLVAIAIDAMISSLSRPSRTLRAFPFLFLAIGARPDNSLYVLAISAFILFRTFVSTEDPLHKNLRGIAGPRAQAATLAIAAALAATGLAFWLNRRSYGIRKLIYFRRVFLELLPDQAEMPLSLSSYLSIVFRVLTEVRAIEILSILVFVVWLFTRKRPLFSEPFAVLGFLMIPLSATRFLLFPDFNTRFFVVPFSLFVLAVTLSAIPRPASSATGGAT
ncbi:MAG: hypothetical protein KBF88_00805 [Polyangiaceae bacterium]|nr:hypothetical protein [Polyangiaceae bacterium]